MPVNESSKSREKAEVARAEGNKLYAERSFFDALVKYNESLCHAIRGSEAVGLALANRSAVYFELKLFEKCLENIEFAKTNGYPQKNFLVLDKRAAKCAELIKSGNGDQKDGNPFDFLKLTYEANPKLPFVVNCLKLKRSEKFGRHIITTRDLKVGDIVAIEDPYFKVLKSDSHYDRCMQSNAYQRCAYCLKDNLLDLMPCETCSASKSHNSYLISYRFLSTNYNLFQQCFAQKTVHIWHKNLFIATNVRLLTHF